MRLFADKYEIVCEQLKRKDKALRNIEAERDLHDESLVSLREEKRMLVDAFQNTLCECSKCMPRASSAIPRRCQILQPLMNRSNNRIGVSIFDSFATSLVQTTTNVSHSITGRVDESRALALDVAELKHLAEQREDELRASEQAREKLERHVEELELEHDVCKRLISDLKSHALHGHIQSPLTSSAATGELTWCQRILLH